MQWMNDSDWNADARFHAAEGVVRLDAHQRGFVTSVSVEEVPGPGSYDLLLLVSSEDGTTGAAVRVRDLLALTLKHYPHLLKEAQVSSSS